MLLSAVGLSKSYLECMCNNLRASNGLQILCHLKLGNFGGPKLYPCTQWGKTVSSVRDIGETGLDPYLLQTQNSIKKELKTKT
jgi:hypothetical protein